MHIKQVLISGFKSFKSQTEIEEFSPRHNVIVGRNGSGKSNFFDAIQFVLGGPKFASLRQEDRQNLLHEGAGTSVMACYVEIIFDNSDGRMSVESDEVVIRRSVGHKKDEFFLNRKRIQKSEVTSLLESAGFSKSNPYYIVQQGKVANLCTMKDADRLQLLKEVAGTSIYEERRAESTKILAETVLKRDEVQRILDFIEKRLTELEHEKEELTEYEQLDKQQKAIEYNVFTHEQATAKAHLESIVQQIDNHSTSLNTLHSGLGSCQEDMATEETQLSDMKTRARKLENKLVSKRKQRNEYEIDRDDKSELRLDYENKESMKEREVEDNNNMLKQINSNITAKEAELAAVNQDITRVTTEMSGYSNQLTSLQSKLEILVNKKNANKLYSTKKERDAYITNNINSINSTIDKKETILHDYVNQMQSLQQALQNSQAKLQRDEKEHADNDRRYNTLIAEINRKIAERNALQDNRKANWATIDALTDEVAKLEQESTNSRNNLNKTLPYAVAQGLNIIEGIVRKHNIQGYYGPLIDNIQIRNEAFYTVLDKAGGNALFNIVVDTDATANVLINHLEEFKVGRLTFVPLNRIRANRKETPRSGAVRSLMESALEYEDYMEPAVHLVFGNKLLTQTLEDAAAAAREFQMDTYTMEGDVVSARGALEGGYHNVKFNRINAIMTIREVTERINSKNDQIEKIKRNHTALEEQINALMREIRQQEIEKDHLSDNNNTLYKEISTNKKNIKVLPSNIQGIAAKVQTIENEISNHRQQIAVYQDELRSPFVVTLTEADVANMQAYEQQIRELNQSVGQYNSRLNTLHQAKTAVEQELNQNLYKAKEEVEFKLHDVQTTTAVVKDFSAEIAKLDLEIEHLGRFIESSEAEIKDLEKQMADLSKQITTSESKIDELKSKEQQFTNQIHEVTSSIDNLQAKQGMDLDKIKSTANALKALGMVSLTESTKFARFSSAQLKKHLDAVNEKLKKYSSVNRKALDQYLSFAGQKEELFKRRNELDNDSNSINLMMQSLDTQKDESIVTTCNNVNQHFINVFAELVPSGKAKLRPILAMDMEGEVEGMDAVDAGNLGNIRGISVEVSFTKNAKGEYIYHSMASLSGGQKALVALALIFAIQRCDPAPFYLFDEIDQALDSNHRLAVARLISRQVNTDPNKFAEVNISKTTKEQHYSPPQFITTTFRPELVQVADRWFGIALQNKVSSIIPLTQEAADDFVTNLMIEEEAVGEVSAMPSGAGYRRPAARSKAVEEEEEESGEEGEEEEGEEGEGEGLDLDEEEAKALGVL